MAVAAVGAKVSFTKPAVHEYNAVLVKIVVRTAAAAFRTGAKGHFSLLRSEAAGSARTAAAAATAVAAAAAAAAAS